MPENPAARWRTDLRRLLLVARKDRDAQRVSVLRSVLSAIDNAETADDVLPSAGAILDSPEGLAASEVARRTLTENEIQGLIRAEIDERRDVAEQLTRAGHTARAAELRGGREMLLDLLHQSSAVTDK